MEEMEGERRVRLNSETLREDHLIFSFKIVFGLTAVSKPLYLLMSPFLSTNLLTFKEPRNRFHQPM
jgi:hypothetical protein